MREVEVSAATWDDNASVSPQIARRELWASRMVLPSAEDLARFRPSGRSPYLACTPSFEGVDGYVAYAVDFRCDAQPRGTYLCVWNGDLELETLRQSQGEASRAYRGVAAYAGFQVLGDGSKVAIMSVWDTFVTTPHGETVALRARQLHPTPAGGEGSFDGEGTGVHCLVPFAWEQGRPYRALVERTRSLFGSAVLTLRVCDLSEESDGSWVRLASFDLGYPSRCLTRSAAFLENFLPETAGELRTMELSNMRVNDVGGGWVSARQARCPGSAR